MSMVTQLISMRMRIPFQEVKIQSLACCLHYTVLAKISQNTSLEATDGTGSRSH